MKGTGPPLVKVAVIVICDPSHTAVSGLIVTCGDCELFTEINSEAVSVCGDTHDPLEVRTTCTKDPFTNAFVIRVSFGPFCTLTPSISHSYAGADPPFTGVATK